ncbi:MAG: FAD-binding oxidoreductase [Acidimicrobiaceae bacterium]|nr:FAD-binding oxidoreductase [Acidimicrobiaceae bacterium]
MTLSVELAGIVGDAGIETDPASIGARLRDNSWLSPVLSGHIDAMAGASAGGSLGVEAVVGPADLDQLAACVAAAYRHDAPITMLGAGTSNFGQSIPMRGGIVIELSRLCEMGDPATAASEGRITVGAGALLGRVDAAVRAHGAEMPVMTTTYAASHAAGWVAGGHVGLGSSSWGTIWDANIVGATVMTCEAEPRLLTLDEDSVEPVLHASGTTGIITDVTFRLVPARSWVEMVVAFPRFDGAARFVVDLSEQTDGIRVAAAQEPMLTPAFTALADDAGTSEALVMTIVAAEEVDTVSALVAARGGRVIPWHGLGADRRPTLAYMVYGHRMLWVKKLFASAAFLHCYLSETRPVDQLLAIKARFGDHSLVELKYIRSRWLRERWGQSGDGVIFAPLVGMVNGRDDLEDLLAFCDDIGVAYQNPHTFFLDEQGLFADPRLLRRFKREVDPKGLLNPGKLSDDPAARMAVS